jgi:hypothetical protein
MANPIEYIVFEPDQVLTNDHLNETFNYLDQQNRWTRNKLIGIGIVCGLDIVLNPGVIEITRGCGVTSQGYLITQDDNSYTWYMPYSPIDVPLDLPFQYPYGDLPFYKPFCAGKQIWLLMTDDQQSALDPAVKLTANAIPSTANSFLNDYVVVLFLEMKEMDLKNCDMLDCNNKGEKMTFQVRPLLVAKKDLPVIKKAPPGNGPTPPINPYLSHQIELKRFNVPYTDLNSTDDVLNAFKNLVDDITLTGVTNALNYSYQKYSAILNITYPFNNLLTNLQSYRDNILAQEPIFIEYFYDFIDDLIKAYYEFAVKVTDVISSCCPDENLFPLHLVLGSASKATNQFVHDTYRNYFIYSPLFSKLGNESAEAVLLFNRIVIMVAQFNILTQTVTEEKRRIPIKITPSQYEYPWLSERCIPYYYNVNVTGSELYKSWNYHKTSHGNAAFNLGYNAYQYNNNSAVVNPLLYDIEYYNFFRVEGHIGLNYQTALTNILNQRSYYNLPIDVVAVSADLLTTGAVLPDCNMRDLETDYKLIIGEAECKIHLNFCFISALPFATFADQIFTTGKLDFAPTTGAINFSTFKLGAMRVPEAVMLANLVYLKGDFMRKYCPAQPGTIGAAYLGALDSNGVFTNPVPIQNTTNAIAIIYHYFFEFIDSVEVMMYALNTNTLADIDMEAFGVIYQTYLIDTVLTITILTEITNQNAVNQQQAGSFVELYQLGLLMDELAVLTSICIDERLQVLKDEYTSRLNLYQNQLNFLNYYKKHPGLEHKAGVPKGGTLVLVYHTAAQNTTVTGINNTGAVFGRAPAGGLQTVTKQFAAPSVYYDDATVQLITSFVQDCQDAPPDKKQILIDILKRRPPVQQTFQVNDGVVIADFYIPYLCCSDCAPVAYIMQQPKQNVYNVTGGGSYCAGSEEGGFHVGLSGSDTEDNYQLYLGFSPVNIPPVPGTGAPLDFGVQMAAGTYTVVATNVSTGTTTNMTGMAAITINPLPTQFVVSGDGSYCAGGTGLGVHISGSETGVNYQLLNGTISVGTPVAGTGSAFDFPLQTAAGTYTVAATNANTGCGINMTGSATINVIPAPDSGFSFQTGDANVDQIIVQFKANALGNALSYEWQFSKEFRTPANLTTPVISAQLINKNLPANVTVTLSVSNSTCPSQTTQNYVVALNNKRVVTFTLA